MAFFSDLLNTDKLKKKAVSTVKKASAYIAEDAKKKEAQKAADFKALTSSVKSGAKTVYEAYKPVYVPSTPLPKAEAEKFAAQVKTQSEAKKKVETFGKTLSLLNETPEMKAAIQRNKLIDQQNAFLGGKQKNVPLPYIPASKNPSFRGQVASINTPQTIGNLTEFQKKQMVERDKREAQEAVTQIAQEKLTKDKFINKKLQGLQYTQSLTGSGAMTPLPELKKQNSALVKQYSDMYDKNKRVASFTSKAGDVFVRDLKKFIGNEKYEELEVTEAWNPARVVPKMMSAAAFDVIDFEDLLQTGKNLKVRDGQLWLNGEPVGEEFTTEKGKKSAQKADIAAALLGSAPTYVGFSKGLAKLITKGAVSKVPSVQKFFGGVQQVQTKYPVLSEIALINPVEEIVEAGVRKGDRQEYTFSDFIAGLGIGAIMGGAVGIAGKHFKSEELEKVLDKAEEVAAKTGDINQVMAVPFGGTNLGTLYKENRFAFNKQVIPGQRPGIEVAAPLPQLPSRKVKFVQEQYDQPVVARDRYDIDKLERISKGGSDRSVHDLGENKVLKVAKTKRGLAQNDLEGDGYVAGEILPDVYERGKNYVVAEKVLFDKDRKKINELTKFLQSKSVYFRPGELDGGKLYNALSEAEEKFEINGLISLADYDLLWGDITAPRNWGVSAVDGRIVHADGGSLSKSILDDKDWLDEDWLDVQNETKKSYSNYKDLGSTLLKSDRFAYLRGHKKTPRAGIDAPAPLPKLEGKAEVMPWDEAAQSKPKTIDVGSSIEAEAKIRDIYKNAGQDAEYPEMTKADKALYEVYEELEMSQAGKRTRTAEGDFIAEPSTFPDWLPAPYRSKELFNKVTQGLELDNLKYPPASAPKQRALYDLILGRIDSKLGVDTATYRNFIQSNNEPKVKPSTASTGGRTGRSFKRRVGRKKFPSYPRTAKPIEGQKLLPAPSEPKLSVPKIKGIPAVASLKYVTDEIKDAMPKAKNPTVKAYDFAKLKELLQNPPSKQLPKGKGKILLPSDSSVLADTIKFKSKGGKVRITRDDFKGMTRLPELKVNSWTKNVLETKIRTFDKLGNWAKENFYNKARKADHDALVEYSKIDKEMLALKKSLPRKSGERIGIYATAQEPEGAKLLEKMGITEIPKLSDQEMKVFEKIRQGYDDFYPRINEARSYEGKEPIKKVKNYFTRILADTPEEAAQRVTRRVGANAPSVSFFKSREGLPSKVDLDAFNVFKKYAQPVTKYIHMAPESSRMRELIRTNLTDPAKGEDGKIVNLAKGDKINTYNFLTRFVDDVTGSKPPEEFEKVMKVLKTLNKNAAYAKLAWNIGSALIQPTAYRNTFAQLKIKNAVRGIIDLMSGKGDEAMAKSQELLGRGFDASIVDALESKGGKFKRVAGDTGLKILQALDGLTARATWLGAYREAKDMKFPENKAISFADDIVVKTQASAAAKDISPIQRTTLGKTMTLFQTFVINDLDFLKRDILGIGNKNLSKKEAFVKTLKYITATALINYLYEDVAGVPSPMPRPGKELLAGNYVEAAKETAGAFPLIGGAAKFGQLPLGTTGELFKTFIQDPIEGKFSNKKAGKALASFAGVPGYNQLVKSYEGLMAIKNLGDVNIKRKGENSYEKLGVMSTMDAIRALAFGPYGSKKAQTLQSAPSLARQAEDLVKISDPDVQSEAILEFLNQVPEEDKEKAAETILKKMKEKNAKDEDVPVTSLTPSQVKIRYEKEIANIAARIEVGDVENAQKEIESISKNLTPEQQEAIAEKILSELK